MLKEEEEDDDDDDEEEEEEQEYEEDDFKSVGLLDDDKDETRDVVKILSQHLQKQKMGEKEWDTSVSSVVVARIPVAAISTGTIASMYVNTFLRNFWCP